MDNVLETAIFDEIYFAECEAKLGVLDALFYECDKLENIMKYSENSDGFQIVQESFTKPSKNESTLTKVALAIPRFIYMLIKKIADGFKKAFGKKENFTTPQTVENASEIIRNLTGSEEFMKMACGAIIGGFAAVKLFCKNRYKEVKTKVDVYREKKNTRAEVRASSQHNYAKFKALATSAIPDMFGFYVKDDNSIGVLIFTDLDQLRDVAVGKYLSLLKEEIDQTCGNAGYYKSKSDFEKLLKDVMFDIDHNASLYTYMVPDRSSPVDYTYNEYVEAMMKFSRESYTKPIEEWLKQVNNSIVTAYQTFERSTKKADEKEEAFSKEAQKKYCDDINMIVGQRIDFMCQWVIELGKAIDKGVEEYNKLITRKAPPKNKPNIEMDDWATTLWNRDREAKDEQREEDKKKELEKMLDESNEKAANDVKEADEQSKKKEDNKSEKKESED